MVLNGLQKQVRLESHHEHDFQVDSKHAQGRDEAVRVEPRDYGQERLDVVLPLSHGRFQVIPKNKIQ